MALYTAQIEKLYVTFFNRPADFSGLAYWEEQMVKTNGDSAVIANAFAASAEYKALYSGKSTAATIETIYQNLFGRAAEPDAIQYWGVRLDNGTFNIGTIANSIAVGAQNLDKTTIANKVTAATAFTATLDTNAEILGYETTTNGQAVKDWLKAVTSDAATLTNATTALPALVTAVVTNSNANPGTTFTLTTGLDTVIGTAGNDAFTADNTTLSASDTISGGAGVDTLTFTDGGTVGGAIPAALVSGVEVINVRNVNTAGASVEAATVTFGSALAVGQTVTLAGRTVTSIGAGASAADVAAALASGVSTATAAVSGALAGYTAAAGGAGIVVFTSTAPGNVADLTAIGNTAGVTYAYVQGTNGAADTVAAGNFVGATDFNSNLSTSALNITGLAAGQKAGIIGNGSIANGDLGVGYGATVTAGVINVSGGTTRGIITETGAGITSNTINSTGAANVLTNVVLSGTANAALTINAATNLTTGNITGFTGTTSTITVAGAAASVNLGQIEAATVKTIAASGLTAGGVTATLNANTLFNFTGGAGNDVITLGGVALLTGAMVDAGAGTADRLIVTANAEITALTAPFIKGFEVVQANTGVTVDVSQLAAFNTITGIRVNDSAGAAVTVNGITAAQAANVAIIAANDATGAITLGLTGASTGGQIDTVNATLTTTTAAGAAQVSNLTGMVLTGVEKLVLTGNNTVAATTGAVTFETSAATSLDSITLTNAGTNSVVIAAGQTATNLNVDASASIGNTTIDASLYATATGATLKGGSGHDIIEGSANGDNIVGGAGNDVLSGTATVGQTAGTALAVGTIAGSIAAATVADTFTGGAGLDVFGIGVGAIGTMSTITDLNFGTAVAGGAVDRIVTDSTNGAALTVVTLSTAQQTAITAAANFAAALDAAIASFGAVANVATTFTYGTDTYFVLNDVAATTTFTATDLVIKITGVTGTLDASDITTL